MIRRPGRLVALLAASSLIFAACGDDDEGAESTETTAAPAEDGETTETTAAPAEDGETTETTEAPAEGGDAWVVNTDDCVDPDAVNEPIEGTINIGSVLPLSGGTAAIAFSPVKAGLEAYIQYANENELVPGYELQISIQDDQYNKDLTPAAVDTLLDEGVHLFAGIIGTENNLAVRDTLNEECVPLLMNLTGAVEWAEVADYPWTTGALVPYDIEAQVYAAQIAEQFPDGATVALFNVNSDFGQTYVDAFNEVAADFGIEVVTEQTHEVGDAAPPTAQLNAIASEAPDAILAVPLGSYCPTFLGELANVKAANAGWDPALFLTNTCASALILGVAGPAADGLYTSNHLKDVNDPAVAAEAGPAEYVAFMTELGNGDVVTTASAGWTVGEVTVEILRLAAESPEGLTRASIINAARSLEYVPILARDGVVYTMNGEDDAVNVGALQVLQYDADTATFTSIGDLVTDFDS
jgi:ABC-type branched-subunit amino acid transport system substrate-binding protein